MMMHRHLMRHVDRWGESAWGFNPGRFLENESRLKSRSYTPLGGGSMLYPGRFMASGELMVFVSLLIQRLDITATGPFPVYVTKSGAGAGVLGPKEGSDTMIIIAEKV